jgi:NADH-quinone oxidoreductase subunit L
MSLRAPFELVVDPLSLTMALIVTGIGSLIFLYSTAYMADERDFSRFFAYLSLFAAAMLILVMGNNLVLLFVGWEGVGLCSYLLIGFWYKDIANAKAANKAFIVNRIGDWGLTLGLFMLILLLASSNVRPEGGRFLSYDTMLPALESAIRSNPGMGEAIALLLFVGACGKSAQFPLYFWLPDAMAGPTPVSALIHAATMVTSGVVLLNRMHVVFELAPVASSIICVIGAFTAVFAAIIAFGQTDIKKVLAYSTVSQLGYMFIACGAGVYWAGMFHVATHAFFKALLFLGSGAVIYAMSHNQDMRNYGNLRKYLPWTFLTMAIGSLALAGIPPLAGYFSKESILHAAFGSTLVNTPDTQLGTVAGWIGLLTAALTAWYMTRLVFLTFLGEKERWRELPEVHDSHEHEDDRLEHSIVSENLIEDPDQEDSLAPIEDPHGFYFASPIEEPHEEHHDLGPEHTPKEVPAAMLVPLVVLAVLSVLGGFLMAKGDVFEHWLYPNGLTVLHMDLAGADKVPVTPLAVGGAILGIILGAAVYWKGLPKTEGWDETKWSPLRRMAASQFGYDNVLSVTGVEGCRDIAQGTWDGLERWVVDGWVRGLAWSAEALGELFRKLQSGYVRFYAMIFVGGVVCLLGYVAIIASHGVNR